MRATAILGKDQRGWIWRASVLAPLRIETSQQHSGDRTQVIHKLDAELGTYSAGQTEITVGIDPAEGDPVPGVDWIEGDELNVDGSWREVEAVALTLDDESGRWVPVPQFGSILDEPDQRVDRTLQGIGGMNGGTSHLTRPVSLSPPPNVRP